MFRLRDATESDAPAIAAIYAPYCHETPITFEIEAPSVDVIRERIAKVLPMYPWLVAEADDRVVGYAYASRHHERAAYRWGVDVGIYLDGACRRRGFGRALYSALLSMIASQGYYTAYAGITLPNDASVGLHRAMGFAPVGVNHNTGYKLGAWHDVMWMEKALRPPRLEPAEPITAAQMRGFAAWQAVLLAGDSISIR